MGHFNKNFKHMQHNVFITCLQVTYPTLLGGGTLSSEIYKLVVQL